MQAFEVAFSKAFAADVTTLSKKLKSQIDNNKEYIEEKDVIRTITICNHVNIKRTDLEKYIDLNSLVVNKKYYIIGYCRQYSDSNERMGVRLAMNLKGSPLIAIDSLRSISKDTFEKCYLFGIDDYISAKQRHLSL